MDTIRRGEAEIEERDVRTMQNFEKEGGKDYDDDSYF
jgi:hypothetical protein